ncbi:hypothetical protein BRAS3809_2570002 [Bradyrhizobium sp. STM 3809]|nr:hypothetical protein BRAS3809_2570002 [Bradyrhizobium sp. STM 3809]
MLYLLAKIAFRCSRTYQFAALQNNGSDSLSGDSAPKIRAAAVVAFAARRNLGVVPGKSDNAQALANADPGPIITIGGGWCAVAPACRLTTGRGYGSRVGTRRRRRAEALARDDAGIFLGGAGQTPLELSDMQGYALSRQDAVGSRYCCTIHRLRRRNDALQ